MEAANKHANTTTLTHGGISWIDLNHPSQEDLSTLTAKYKLHPVHLQESVQKIQHSKVEVERNYLFFVLHFPIYNDRSHKILFGQLGFFLGKDFIITVHDAGCQSIAMLHHQLQNRPEMEKAFSRGPAFMVYKIVNTLIDELSYLTDSVIGELDRLEDAVFENNISDGRRIGQVRQKIVRLMRLIGPKRVILQDLSEQVSAFADHDMAKLYANNTKRASKLWEIIEEAKETVEIYKDADFTTSTEKTNDILAVLTLIFTLTIPTTVISGLYGMNIHLPGAITATSWTFLGRYTTFEILLALSVLAALGMYAYFRRRKWF